jgi:hypothetical protein
LQRRTGLDRVLRCTPAQLPTKPTRDPITQVPVIPVPTNSPCLIQAAPQ